MAIYTLTLNFRSLSNLTYTWKDMFRKKKKLIFRKIEEKSKNVTILKLKSVSIHRRSEHEHNPNTAYIVERVRVATQLVSRASTNRARLSHDPHIPPIRFPPHHRWTHRDLLYRHAPVRAVHDHLDTS